MEISTFQEKLNKIDGNIYVVEERVELAGGVYDAPLQHDNINTSTLSVYTGPKLTGERIQTYVLSTPSLTPWKRTIRVYADVPTVYISYEAEGDTVEAEDVNRLHEEMIRTQEAINGEISRAGEAEQNIAADLEEEVTRAKATEQALDQKKANATEVESELNRRYTKDQTFSRQEVLDKIEALIGAAPEALDTLQEIAAALGEDPNFAATVVTMLSGKVDKEEGKGLSSNDYTGTEKADLADVNGKKHTHSNKTILDGITSALIVNWNAAFTHISDVVKHITAAERAAWNTVSNKVDTIPGKGLSTNDYTTGEKNKLAGIATGAEVNVQADWNVTDTASDACIKNKPTSMPASDVSTWAKATSKPSYAWSEITSKPASFPPAAHTHTKSQITDMSTKVSEFENDTGYITAADIDTSQNHTHANKTLLDTITQTLLNNWNAAYTHVSNKSNPHSVTAAQVGAAATSHVHVKADITDFPSSIPAEGGNADTVNGHTVNADVPSGAKFTDTVYTHPNSGVTAGTYKAVTVNAQGHVTAGTNPTTLAGYGITDAATKTHNHDSAYMKKIGLTWDDLKGV